MAQQNDREFTIPKNIKVFAKLTKKKFKKELEDRGFYDFTKKELKIAYYEELLMIFPEVINFIIKYGYLNKENVQEMKNLLFKRITDPDFVKFCKRSIKEEEIDDIKLFPIVIAEILERVKEDNARILAKDPNASIYNVDDLTELSQLILQKKIKKLTKKGIPVDVAFDALSIIPCKEALSGFKRSQFFRIRSFYDALYEHAKTKDINFKTLVNVIIPEDYVPALITFALLERKEKFSHLTDEQKKFYNTVTTWCLDRMENDLDQNEVVEVLTTYKSARKRDDAQGKDSNRRYSLGYVSEADYPTIHKIVKKLSTKEDFKQYL